MTGGDGASRCGIKNLTNFESAAEGVGNGTGRLRVEIGKIGIAAVAHGQGRDRAAVDEGLAEAGALIIAEEEGLVSLDRTTSGEAELVLAELSFGHACGVVEEVVGIEFVVAQEFP